MKTYQCHKVVRAAKCDALKKINPSQSPAGMISLKANDGEIYDVPQDFFARGEPHLPFYIVEYDGGYRSWSPADAFEKGYTELPCAKTE